jgi:hypothetical protein
MFEDINVLIGKVLTKIDVHANNKIIMFHTKCGEKYKMYHDQGCCEEVYIDDIVGDLINLLGYPVTMAEKIGNVNEPCKSDYEESFTWTFYKLATVKGYVTIRWYGKSNGYYSEDVDFYKVT